MQLASGQLQLVRFYFLLKPGSSSYAQSLFRPQIITTSSLAIWGSEIFFPPFFFLLCAFPNYFEGFIRRAIARSGEKTGGRTFFRQIVLTRWAIGTSHFSAQNLHAGLLAPDNRRVLQSHKYCVTHQMHELLGSCKAVHFSLSSQLFSFFPPLPSPPSSLLILPSQSHSFFSFSPNFFPPSRPNKADRRKFGSVPHTKGNSARTNIRDISQGGGWRMENDFLCVVFP